MLLSRRKILTGLVAAPVIVAADSLMPLRGRILSAADLVVYPFTVSWVERIGGSHGIWRQRARRFTAYGDLSSVEVNPASDAEEVAGVQVDPHGAWVGETYFPPPKVGEITWREGRKVFGYSRYGSVEFQLESADERQLRARHGGGNLGLVL